jgi:hypothetical protein
MTITMARVTSLWALVVWSNLIATCEASILSVGGDLMVWHKVTLELQQGVFASEDGDPNPFLFYRFDVTLSQGATSLQIPGYFAADGDAVNTGATSGTVWRAHFCPPSIGVWKATVSFSSGTNIALAKKSESTGTPVAHLDGVTTTFNVSPSDKPSSSKDFRGKGMLRHVSLI